ncbi:sigma-70 family RNA polymerase sigma factor [Rhizobium rhizogenes]|uniref:sigma-70 family RNA polymerase sigma factor n=1 Tax=Rhizobium rhizogenes TaxID=359 RepID=UPI001573D468|nr:sigma-70 family RNA polymerase sigma factor [Rhizobium rhizogenes]NTG41135.1 sigma-70 family RNA polymerase sigma factor [Rhizobium rhizogenes]
MHISETEFDRFLVAHLPLIYSTASRYMTTHSGYREDLVQIACLYVLERREQYDPSLGAFSTWLRFQLMGAWGGSYRTATRRRLRHECSMPTDEEGEQFIHVPVFEDPSHRLDLEHVLETMRWLKDSDLLFDLCINERVGRAIARERGQSPQAVQQRMARARDRLVRALNGGAMIPFDFVAEPHAFILGPDPVTSVADATPAVPQDEQEEWKPERVMMTSTSALTRFVDMLQAAGVTMPPPASTGRSILSLHH